MKKSVLILFIGINITCIAQTSVWEVKADGNSIYIGGTVHVLRPQDYPLPPEYDSAYIRSDQLVFEADMEKLGDQALLQQLMMKAMYAGDTTLETVISTEAYKALEAEYLKFNIPVSNLKKLKPSMVIITLTALKMKQLGLASDGIDKYYFDKAKTDKKELSFLESIEDQIDIMVNMGIGDENEFVLYSLKDFDNMEEELMELIETWRDGSAKNMVRQINEMKMEFPEIYNKLLVERNEKWMPKIEAYLFDKKIEFIMVGALHLHGPDGILKKLKERNYEVVQWMF